jgi:hypothetical protein
MEDIKRQLTDACNTTIEILQTCRMASTSKIVEDKVDAGLLEVTKLKAELGETNLDRGKCQYIADRLTALGKDLITYGTLILPPNQKN